MGSELVCLDINVGISHTGVMITDIEVKRSEFRQTLFARGVRKSSAHSVTRPKLPTVDELQSLDFDEIAERFADYMAARRGKTLEEIAAGPRTADGSLTIPSMEAVTLLGALGRQIGRPKFIDLRKVENLQQLRSLRGLAELASDAVEGELPCQ